jgi:uncharacterized protein involved in type VI secretion and phage assembly
MALMHGLSTAVVAAVDDKQGHGRVRLTYPTMPGQAMSKWTQVASPMGGKDRGVWLIPEVGDVAVVGFERGNVDDPFVLGFVWNDIDKPPSTSVRERMIRSVNGHTIRMLDSTPKNGNKGALVIEDAHGNSIVLTNGSVRVLSKGQLELYAAGAMHLSGPGYRRRVLPNNNPI